MTATKECAACRVIKPAADFRATPAGNRRSKCRECERADHRAWYAAQAEKPSRRPEMKAYYREWYAKNRERLIVKNAARNRATPEARRVICRENMRRNREALGDRYIRRMLAQDAGLKSADIPQPLVEAQRELLKIKRYLKESAR